MSRNTASYESKKWDIQMGDPVIADHYEVQTLLEQLELTREGLVEAARYAERERRFCTAYDAVGFASITVYDKAARRLREIFCGPCWEKDDSDNQAAIVNRRRGVRVVPCNFDHNTGSSVIQPTNRSPKGEVSRAKTRCNRTGWLPFLPDIPAQDGRDLKTWILGIYAVDDQPLRAELSFPVDFDGSHFTRFSTRVILLDGSEDDAGVERTPARQGPTDFIDVPVRRK